MNVAAACAGLVEWAVFGPHSGVMGYAHEAGPIAMAHRGAGVLAPENTITAFATSTDLGYRFIESDLRSTADGHLVCFHDAALDRVTGARGPIAARTLAQLRALRVDGEAIPTFREALEAFPDTYFSIDLKDEVSLRPLVELLKMPGVAERVCVAGAWDRWLCDVRREVPGVATTLGWQSLTMLVACARAGVRPPRRVATGPFAHVPLRLGRFSLHVERLVGMAHDLGIRVVTWTVDDAPTMNHLLDIGVDAVITDRPDTLRAVLVARGAWQAMGSPATVRTRRGGMMEPSTRSVHRPT